MDFIFGYGDDKIVDEVVVHQSQIISASCDHQRGNKPRRPFICINEWVVLHHCMKQSRTFPGDWPMIADVGSAKRRQQFGLSLKSRATSTLGKGYTVRFQRVTQCHPVMRYRFAKRSSASL
jgi:hypothetical protein